MLISVLEQQGLRMKRTLPAAYYGSTRTLLNIELTINDYRSEICGECIHGYAEGFWIDCGEGSQNRKTCRIKSGCVVLVLLWDVTKVYKSPEGLGEAGDFRDEIDQELHNPRMRFPLLHTWIQIPTTTWFCGSLKRNVLPKLLGRMSWCAS